MIELSKLAECSLIKHGSNAFARIHAPLVALLRQFFRAAHLKTAGAAFAQFFQAVWVVCCVGHECSFIGDDWGEVRM